jgi:hypothetical protein
LVAFLIRTTIALQGRRRNKAVTKGTLQTITNGMFAIGVAASVAVGSLCFAVSAEARVPSGDRVGKSAILCGAIQDDFDSAADDYKNADSDEAKQAALEQMQDLDGEWYNEGCQGWYGSINARRVPAGTKVNVAHLDTVGTVQEPQAGTRGPVVAGGAVVQSLQNEGTSASQPRLRNQASISSFDAH